MQDQERQEVFENDIEMWLDDYCMKKGIENLRDETQLIWYGAMGHVCKHLFKGTRILKSSKLHNVEGVVTESNFNAYDIEKVVEVLEIYCQLCYENNKEVTQIGFSKLTGIDHDTLYDWGKGAMKLSSSGLDVTKRLKAEREASLSAMLSSGTRNPVGLLAILNHFYGWNLPGVSKEPARIQSRSPEEIAALYGSKLSDNGALEVLPDMPD